MREKRKSEREKKEGEKREGEKRERERKERGSIWERKRIRTMNNIDKRATKITP